MASRQRCCLQKKHRPTKPNSLLRPTLLEMNSFGACFPNSWIPVLHHTFSLLPPSSLLFRALFSLPPSLLFSHTARCVLFSAPILRPCIYIYICLFGKCTV